MYSIIKTFIDSGEDKFGSHNAYYSNAHAWLVERYGTLTSWYHDGIMMDSVEMSDTAKLHLGNITWGYVKTKFDRDIGISLPHDLEYVRRYWNNRCILYDTERVEYSSIGETIRAKYFHDIIALLPDEITALEFKLAVG
jgi:hypothetical protein